MSTPEPKSVAFTRSLETIRSGRSLLFIGAGYSFSSVNVEGDSPPGSHELARKIATLAGLEDDGENDLKYVSEYYLSKNDPLVLIRLLENLFTIREATDAHSSIVSKEWRRIYTTNYDNCIEVAGRSRGKVISSVTTGDSPSEFLARDSICVHINGSIDRLNVDSLNSSFKLTRSSYISPESFRESDWFYAFKRDLEWCSSIFFVGYSLYDIEIERLLFEVPEFKAKTFFVVGPNPSQKEVFILSRYGTVLPVGIVGFAEEINKVEPAITEREFYLEAFKEYNTFETRDRINDSIIWDFLMYGRLSQPFIDLALASLQQKPYLIVRQDVKKVSDYLMEGNTVVIHSELGNGKSLFCSQVAASLTSAGQSVFVFRDIDGDYISDVDKILLYYPRAILIIDGYLNCKELINYLSSLKSHKLAVLISERSYSFDRSYSWLKKKYPQIIDVNIDILSDSECEYFISIIDNLGGWDSNTGLTAYQKNAFIKKANKRQISASLLSLFEAPQIRERIQSLLNPLLTSIKAKDSIFAICLLQYLNYPGTRASISEVSGNDRIYHTDFTTNMNFRSLFMLIGNEVQTRSSLFALHLIRTCFSSSYIIDRLLYTSSYFNQTSNGSSMHGNILKSILSVRFVEAMLPDAFKLNSLVRYYEELKVQISWLSDEPHFWLQYAIARLNYNESLDDLHKAQRHLKQAYAAADKRYAYDKSSLDTQQARLYLSQSLVSDDSHLAHNLFVKAHAMLRPLENNKYKFRQVLAYYDYYQRKYFDLRDEQQHELISACKFMLEATSKSSGRYNSNDEKCLQECRDKLSKIIASHSQYMEE